MIRALLLTLLLAAPAWAEADGGVVEPDAGLVLTEAPAAEQAESDDDDDGDEDEGELPSDPELEAALDAALADAGILYTSDLSDEELARRWVEAPETLGSISVGVTEAGRLINGVTMPAGDAWQVVDPNNAWGTQETIEFLVAAANSVRDQFKDAPALRINHIGKKSGGYLRPHQSHQAGRDVDLGFFYPRGEDPGRLSKKRELAMDLPMNWALVKSLIVHGDVEFVLVDKRIQKRLYDYAVSIGEDKEWLDKLFHAGNKSMVRHARRHRDHFHVRYFGARSQELGRRIGPLLAKQPEQNLVIHRVRKGDTLGGIASKYNSGVKLIQKANGLSSTNLKVGRTLNVPLRGPCTSCPVPAPLVLPPRCLPPELVTKS
ncbi:MAG TPA: penicillin-insensitive murein endopeptidase [Archangium sp.]